MVDGGRTDRASSLVAPHFVSEQPPQQAETTAVGWPEPPASKSDMQRSDTDPFPLLPSHLALLDR